MSNSPEPTNSSADLAMRIGSADGLLLATVSGRFTLKRGLEVFKAICDRALANGFEQILIDCAGMSGEISIRERYEFGKEIAGNHRNWLSLKIALVGEEPVITGVGIATAQNRGLNVALFSDRQRALAWLHDPNSRMVHGPEANTGD